MARIKCHFYPDCKREATRNIQKRNLCELHYAKIDENKAYRAALYARACPPHKIVERKILLKVLVEMMGEDEVHSVLRDEIWYQKIKE